MSFLCRGLHNLLCIGGTLTDCAQSAGFGAQTCTPLRYTESESRCLQRILYYGILYQDLPGAECMGFPRTSGILPLKYKISTRGVGPKQ